MIKNISNDLEFLIDLAYQSGELLLKYFQNIDLKTEFKSDRSIVTEADLAADNLIAQALEERFPNDWILSEELQPNYPSETETVNPTIWIVDPLDGTTNYSLGLHIWGVLLAQLIDGYPELAVLYFPLIDELYSAQRGGGAYLNNKQIKVLPPNPGRPLPFFTCCSRTFQNYKVNIPYKTRILGSAAYTFCCIARGIAILGFEATPKIWDIAGAWLLVKEAGGFVEPLHGNNPFPLRSGIDYAKQEFPTLVAATPDLAAKAHKQIKVR